MGSCSRRWRRTSLIEAKNCAGLRSLVSDSTHFRCGEGDGRALCVPYRPAATVAASNAAAQSTALNNNRSPGSRIGRGQEEYAYLQGKQQPVPGALVGASALSMIGGTQAVNIGAMGAATSIYPYYTVRADSAGNAYATLLSIAEPHVVRQGRQGPFPRRKTRAVRARLQCFWHRSTCGRRLCCPDVDNGGEDRGTGGCVVHATAVRRCCKCAIPRFQQRGLHGRQRRWRHPDWDQRGVLSDHRNGASYSSSSATGRAISHTQGVPPCGATLSDTQAEPMASGSKAGYSAASDLHQCQLRHGLHPGCCRTRQLQPDRSQLFAGRREGTEP